MESSFERISRTERINRDDKQDRSNIDKMSKRLQFTHGLLRIRLFLIGPSPVFQKFHCPHRGRRPFVAVAAKLHVYAALVADLAQGFEDRGEMNFTIAEH